MKKLEEYETPIVDSSDKYDESEGGLSGPWPDGNWIDCDIARDLERKLAMCRDALREIYRKPACEAFKISQRALENLKATEPK